MKIHKAGGVEYWYDRSVRCWYAAKRDADGNQIGNAVHAATREGIAHAIKTVLRAEKEASK